MLTAKSEFYTENCFSETLWMWKQGSSFEKDFVKQTEKQTELNSREKAHGKGEKIENHSLYRYNEVRSLRFT